MIFDLHIHTRKYSDCSFINPEELILQAAAARLDGLALTEHGMRWPDKEFDGLQKLADSCGILLINGQEIYTADEEGKMDGEFLVFGMKRSLTRRCFRVSLLNGFTVREESLSQRTPTNCLEMEERATMVPETGYTICRLTPWNFATRIIMIRQLRKSGGPWRFWAFPERGGAMRTKYFRSALV